jgi:hypothetical protein
MIRRSIAAGLFLLSRQKEPKTLVIRKASLPHGGFALRLRQNLGRNLSALLRSRNGLASAEICYALPLHRPPLFCLIPAEAFLLTGWHLWLG